MWGSHTTYAVGVYDYPGTRDYNNALDLAADIKANNSVSVSQGKPPVDISLDVPTSQIGIAVPYVIGRHVISGPEVLSYANLAAIYQTDTETVTSKETVNVFDRDEHGNRVGSGIPQYYEVTSTTTVQTTYITGYTMDIVMGLCLGPSVRLVGIYYNNEKIWTGNIGPARATITMPLEIDALSGCEMIFHGGAFDQTRDPVFDGDTDADNIPGYVGISYVIFRKIRADLPLEALFFEVERFPNPLGLTTAQNRIGNDINTVSAIVDVLTNSWGGAGLPLTDLNTALIATRAITAYNEGNAVSVLEHSNASYKGILGDLLGVLNGMLYQNPGTGKLEISLVRKDFTFNINNNITSSDLISLRDFDKSGWVNTLEKLSGNFTDRSKDYKPNSIFASLTNITDKSKVGTRNYGYVMTKALSKQLLARDLGQTSLPAFALSFEATRKAADLLPGSIVTLSFGEYKLYGTPIVVDKVTKLSINDNSIIIDGHQLIRSDVMPVFDSSDDDFNPGFNFNPVAPATAKFLTLPYWIARAVGAVTSSVSNNVVCAMALPRPANALQTDFAVYSQYRLNGTTASSYVRYVDSGMYQTFGKLVDNMSKFDGWLTGKLATMKITNVINPINVADVGLDGVRDGKLLILIGNELLSCESFTQTGSGEYTLNNVYRALIDTVAADHATDDDVVILNNNYRGILSGLFYYKSPSSYDFSITSSTVNIDGRRDVPAHTKQFVGIWGPNQARTLAPYRAIDTKIGGVRNTDRVDIFLGDTVNFSWKNRSRANNVIPVQADASDTYEVAYNNTSQYVDIMLGGVSVWQSDKEDDTPTSNITVLPTTGVPLGNQTMYIKTSLDFSFGTLSNIYRDELLINVLPYGVLGSEDGASYLISEDGNSILVSEDV